MKYHNITKSDILNGSGIGVVLWVAGCNHHCPSCQNPVTHDPTDGIDFTEKDFREIFDELKKDYCTRLTLSGGDPLHEANIDQITEIAKLVKLLLPDKKIWLYTGYTYEKVKELEVMQYIDVLVDGRYVEDLNDVQYHWAGSTNQRVIDVVKSLENGKIILWKDENQLDTE